MRPLWGLFFVLTLGACANKTSLQPLGVSEQGTTTRTSTTVTTTTQTISSRTTTTRTTTTQPAPTTSTQTTTTTTITRPPDPRARATENCGQAYCLGIPDGPLLYQSSWNKQMIDGGSPLLLWDWIGTSQDSGFFAGLGSWNEFVDFYRGGAFIQSYYPESSIRQFEPRVNGGAYSWNNYVAGWPRAASEVKESNHAMPPMRLPYAQGTVLLMSQQLYYSGLMFNFISTSPATVKVIPNPDAPPVLMGRTVLDHCPANEQSMCSNSHSTRGNAVHIGPYVIMMSAPPYTSGLPAVTNEFYTYDNEGNLTLTAPIPIDKPAHVTHLLPLAGFREFMIAGYGYTAGMQGEIALYRYDAARNRIVKQRVLLSANADAYMGSISGNGVFNFSVDEQNSRFAFCFNSTCEILTPNAMGTELVPVTSVIPASDPAPGGPCSRQLKIYDKAVIDYCPGGSQVRVRELAPDGALTNAQLATLPDWGFVDGNEQGQMCLVRATDPRCVINPFGSKIKIGAAGVGPDFELSIASKVNFPTVFRMRKYRP